MSNAFLYGQTGSGSSGGGENGNGNGYLFIGTGAGNGTITFTGDASNISAAYSAYQAHSVDLLVTLARPDEALMAEGTIISMLVPKQGESVGGILAAIRVGDDVSYTGVTPIFNSVTSSGTQITVEALYQSYHFADDTTYYLSLG